jgi:hypothetical protein
MVSKKLSDKELQKLGADMLDFFEYGYRDRKKMLYVSFLKGLATGFGVFLGGTVLIVLLIWVFSMIYLFWNTFIVH